MAPTPTSDARLRLRLGENREREAGQTTTLDTYVGSGSDATVTRMLYGNSAPPRSSKTRPAAKVLAKAAVRDVSAENVLRSSIKRPAAAGCEGAGRAAAEPP